MNRGRAWQQYSRLLNLFTNTVGHSSQLQKCETRHPLTVSWDVSYSHCNRKQSSSKISHQIRITMSDLMLVLWLNDSINSRLDSWASQGKKLILKKSLNDLADLSAEVPFNDTNLFPLTSFSDRYSWLSSCPDDWILGRISSFIFPFKDKWFN